MSTGFACGRGCFHANITNWCKKPTSSTAIGAAKVHTETGKVFRVAGIDIVMFNHLPTTNRSAATGENNSCC